MSTSGRYEYVDHDADLGIRVEAGDIKAAWRQGARALVGVLTDVETVREVREVTVLIEAPDLAAAWVDSLAELLYHFEVDGLLLPMVKQLKMRGEGDGIEVEFVAAGEVHDPRRHPAGTGVKAVTHHGASMALDQDGRWRGEVLLDL